MVARLKQTMAEDGPLAVMPYNFAGTIGMLQRYAGEQFFARVGATEMLGDICGATACDAMFSVTGAIDQMDAEDLERSPLHYSVGHKYSSYERPSVEWRNYASAQSRRHRRVHRSDKNIHRSTFRLAYSAQPRQRRGTRAGDDARDHS